MSEPFKIGAQSSASSFALQIAPDFAVEFVLDTGFAGYLTLPQAAVDALGLPYRQSIPTRLADGSRQMMDTFAATIVWQNAVVEVEVLATGATPLMRTALLEGNTVCITFWKVERSAFPRRKQPLAARA